MRTMLVPVGVVICLFLCLSSSEARGEAYRYDADGQRDPFVPLLGAAVAKRAKFPPLKEVVSPDEIRLEGVASGRGGSLTAIMNGEMVRENTTIGALTVTKITDKLAVIVLGGKEYTVKLPKE